MKLSNTEQRRIIIEELRRLDCHPTADELFDIVRSRLPRISLATVYRNLELLSEDGQILKLECGGRQKRFDGCIDNHYHVRCPKCDRVSDLSVDGTDEIDRLLSRLVDGKRYTGYRLELSGLCPACRDLDEPALPL